MRSPAGFIVARLWAACCFIWLASFSCLFADQHTVEKYEIQKGDSLWNISKEFLLGGLLYEIIFEQNRDLIRNPDLIYPGDVLTIPPCDSISACLGEKARRAINKKFPPVDEEKIRKAAIESSFEAIASMTEPNLVVSLPVREVQAAASLIESLSLDIVDGITIRGSEQILEIDIDLEGELTASSLGINDEALSSLIERLKPEIRGSIRAGFGVSAGLASAHSDTISIKMFPQFRSISIEKMTLSSGVEFKEAVNLIEGVVNKFADNITGELTRMDFSIIKIPKAPIGSVNASIKDEISYGGVAKINSELMAQDIIEPLQIDSIAPLIDRADIKIIAQLDISNTLTLKNAETREEVTFQRLRSQFESAEANSGLKQNSSSWPRLAIKKSLLADAISIGFAQARPCLRVNALFPRQAFAEKVRLPNEDSINCTPNRNCRQNRDCTQSRDCGNACLFRTPRLCALGGCVGGDCLARGNDPLCEADKAAKKFDCERLKEQKRLICEVEKTAEKTFCEGKKEIVKRLSRTGNFANIEGSVQARGDVKACFESVIAAPDLSKINFGLRVSGFANGHIGLKFVPLDIVGHIVCVAPWTTNKEVRVHVRSQDIAVSLGIDLENTQGGLRGKGTVVVPTLNAELDPPPHELIRSNFNMRLACPIVNSFAEVTLFIAPFIPELNGDVELSEIQDEFEFEFNTFEFSLPWSKKERSVRVSSGRQAIVVEAR